MRIAKWKWTRDPKSLAAGKILGNSSHEPVLYLVNLVPGQYIFNLKIWDDQVSHGQSSYWTAKSSFFFLTSDHPEAENLGPKLHSGGGFFGP